MIDPTFYLRRPSLSPRVNDGRLDVTKFFLCFNLLLLQPLVASLSSLSFERHSLDWSTGQTIYKAATHSLTPTPTLTHPRSLLFLGSAMALCLSGCRKGYRDRLNVRRRRKPGSHVDSFCDTRSLTHSLVHSLSLPLTLGQSLVAV